MASSIQILRSTTAKERPFPGSLLEGQPAVNVNATEPGLFFKASDGSLLKIGPAAITSDGAPPNTGGVGQQGNCAGELWLDKSVNPPVLKVFDGTQWIDAGSGGGGGGTGAFVRWIYTAIGGETSLSGISDDVVLDYVPGLEEVFVNGVLITRDVDYSATNGSSITNLQPLTVGDVVTVTSIIPTSVIELPGEATLLRWATLASSGQTVLSGLDSSNQTLEYDPGFEEVFINGAFLTRGVDYIATDGSSITLTTPLTLNNEVSVLAWSPFTVGSISNQNIASNAAISSTKLEYFAPGLDAQPRTIESKLRDTVSVKDFGAVGDGVYEDTAAIQAAVNYAVSTNKIVYAPSGRYLIDGEISFVSLASSGLQAMGIVGDGPNLTVFIQSNNNSDTFSFRNQNTSRQFCIRPYVKSLSIEYRSVTGTNTGAAIRHREALNGIFSELVIESAPYGIYSERGAQCWYEKIYYRTASVLANNFAKAFIVLDTNLATNSGSSFGNYISNCEMQAGSGCDYSLWIRSVDGLFVTNCHFDFAKTTIYIDCDGTNGRLTVRHLLFSNNYFDVASTYNDYTVFVRAAGLGGAATLFGFHFSNNVFRSQTAQAVGFRVAGSVDGLQGLSYLRRVSFVGNEFLGFIASSINFASHPTYDPKQLFSDITIIGNSFANQAATPVSSALVVRGSNWVISGNIYTGNWPEGGSSVIIVSRTSKCNINGETFNVAKLVPIDLDPSTTEDLLIYGNIDSSTAQYVSEILEEGTNTNGYYIKYKDGRLMCRKYINAAGIDINTAFGTLFRTSNLISGQTAMAQTFIAPPDIKCTAAVTDAAAWPALSGTATTTSFPSTLNIVCPTSLTNKTVNVWLEASGRWRS